jgi:hypothetical protein
MCSEGRVRGNGRAKKVAFSVLRKIGKKRRIKRGDVPREE